MPRDRSGYNRTYYHANRERLIGKAKEHYEKNREKKKAYLKEYLSRPDKKAMRKAYNSEYAKKPEVKAKDRERKQKKKEWYRNYAREYYHRNKERINGLRRKGGLNMDDWNRKFLKERTEAGRRT